MLIPNLFERYDIRAPGALHIGASDGQEADEYQSYGIEEVIWIEALPDVFQRLLTRIEKYPKARALQACISDKDGEHVQFNVANNAGQSSSILEFGTHAKEHPDVLFTEKIEMTTRRVDTLLHENGIVLGHGWFLNIDLQGAELLALKGMGKLLSHFDHACIEVNEFELYKNCCLVGDIDKYLGRKGLLPIEVKMTSAGWGEKYYRRTS